MVKIPSRLRAFVFPSVDTKGNPTLLFKKKFLPLIRRGTKTQTIRLWTRPRVKPGQRAYVPGLGRILITHVDMIKSISILTRADAIADGFPTRRALLAEIARIYVDPERVERNVYRVKFLWPAPETPTPKTKTKTKSRTKTKTQKTRRPTPAAKIARETLRQFVLGKMPR